MRTSLILLIPVATACALGGCSDSSPDKQCQPEEKAEKMPAPGHPKKP